MDVLTSLYNGFLIVLTWQNLTYCFLGVLVGTLIGVLPGLGPAATIALLLPATYHLNPTSGLIVLAGVVYGAMYGGSTTAILVNIPGETASIVTCIDGYKMALQGRAGAALGIAAFGSFIGGTISVLGLALTSTILGGVALRFGPPEYFALIFLCFSILMYLSSGSMIKAAIMAVVGIFLGTIGMDMFTGELRFTYGSLTLMDGMGLVPVVMGIFGIAEVLANIGTETEVTVMKHVPKLRHLLPNRQDWRDSIPPIFRGTLIGFLLGLLPGGGFVMASFTSYAVERRVSKHPERFGSGAIEGVAGPETANNAAVAANFIPLVSLGIPANVVMALIMGALMMYGIKPGPTFITDNPGLFWGVVASMYVGNVMLLVLNLPLIGIWVRLLKVPYRVLFPFILLFCAIGVYCLNNNIWELIIMTVFGLFGYLMRKFEYEGAPFVFAMVLSPLMEINLRKSLLMSDGNFGIFFTRPISLTLMIVGTILLCLPLFPFVKRKVFKEEY
jgi:putative tricarboxylic transport membrane protein